MVRSARHLLSPALLALHMLAILVGPCAHEWAGIKHRTGTPPPASRIVPDAPDGLALCLSPADDPGDACPICQYIAQAQIGPDRCCPRDAGSICTGWDAIAPPAPIPAAPLRAQPRAPPIAAGSAHFSA